MRISMSSGTSVAPLLWNASSFLRNAAKYPCDSLSPRACFMLAGGRFSGTSTRLHGLTSSCAIALPALMSSVDNSPPLISFSRYSIAAAKSARFLSSCHYVDL